MSNSLGGRVSQWLALLVTLVGLLLVATGFSQAELLRLYFSKEGQISDNQTWVISQLDVDYQKLKHAVVETESVLVLEDYELIPPEAWAQLVFAFDIYYSRLRAVESQGASLAAMGDLPERYTRNAALMRRHRVEMAEIFDAVETPDPHTIEAISKQLAVVEMPIRSMALDTLSVLSAKADFERNTIRRHIVLNAFSFSLTILVLSAVAVTIYFLLRISRKQVCELDHSIKTRKRILEQTSGIFIFTDGEGNIISSNRGARKTFGWKEDQILHSKIWNVLLPEKRRRCSDTMRHAYWVKRLKAGESVTIREIAMHKSGKRLPVEVTITYLEVDDEQKYLYTIRSLVLEQRTMRALRRERINAEERVFRNNRLLSVMSHEMRTSLQAMTSALELARLHKPGLEVDKLLHVAESAAHTTLSFADDAIDLVQIETQPESAHESQFSPSQIVTEIADMLRPAAKRHGNTIRTIIGYDCPDTVIGKPNLLRHAISNLLSNAIKFTANGKITINVEGDAEAKTVKIQVTDTGVGISQEDQLRIMSDAHFTGWKPNFRGGWNGSGLGFGLFKRAVSIMGGTWGLTSVPGKGTCVWFNFEAHRQERARMPGKLNQSQPARLPFSSLNVLLVDDNAINLKLVSMMLEKLGINHKSVCNGTDAVREARVNPFDIVILDIGMPGLDGYETAIEIRKADCARRAVLIAFTADPELRRNTEELRRSGFDDLLVKPVTIKSLQRIIECNIDLKTSTARSTNTAYSAVSGEIVDEDAIEHLVELGGHSSLSLMVDNLLSEAATLESALHNGNAKEVKALQPQFHGMAGAASIIGAVRISKVALDIEKTIEEQNFVPDSYKRALTDAVTTTEEAFEHIMAGLQK